MKNTRRAFTLIELLAVIGIIALLTAALATLRPTSPTGLNGATAQAQSVFSLARAQAMLANNPDPNKPTWKLYTPRARVLILNQPDDDQNHLRKMGVILGGQLLDPNGTQKPKSETTLQESDLQWYSVGDATMLPEGIYFVPSDSNVVSKSLFKSSMLNKTFPTDTMKVEFGRRQAQQSGSGQNWYYYEFLSSGAANMTDVQQQTGARFMVVEGIINPSSKQLEAKPGVENSVGGFLILRPGNTISINNISSN